MADKDVPLGDPGWGKALRAVGWGVLPIPGLSTVRRRRVAQDRELTTLVIIRTTFASFAWSLVMIGVVTLVLARSLDKVLAPLPTALGVAAIGAAAWWATHRLPPLLDGTDEAALATTYRTRFFLRIALAEVAAVFGFLGFILTAQPLVYLVGAVFAGLGFVAAAPSAGNLERDQRALMVSGSTLSLYELLTSMRPGTPEAG